MCIVPYLLAPWVLAHFSISVYSLEKVLSSGFNFFLLIGCLGILDHVGGFKDNKFFCLVFLFVFSTPAFRFLVEISSGLTVFDVILEPR